MSKLRKSDGSLEPYTEIPNVILRSTKYDAYDKVVFAIIRSCNPAYPTYETIRKWSGLSTDRIWKSLRVLEEGKLIYRFKRGRAVEYVTYWDIPKTNPEMSEEYVSDAIKFRKKNVSVLRKHGA